MTPISVGSAGSSGATTGTRGAPSNTDAAPQGFDLLLAGAHSAQDTGSDPTGKLSRDSSDDHRRDSDTANATATGKTKKADRRGDAGASDKTGDCDDPGNDPAPKADAGSDQAVLAAAAAAALAQTPPTPVVPQPDPVTTAVTTADTVPTTDATTIDANALLALAAESAAAAGLDGSVNSEPITNPVTPPVDPKLLPVPTLPPVPHADPNLADANASAPASSSPPPSVSPATAPEHPRPAPAATTMTSGAAAFAAAPPANTPAVTNVNVDAGATATAAVAPPPPSEQLVSVLTPMRNTENGTYTLRLELKPPELGRVEMRVEMRDGVLHASIHAEHEGSGQLLRDALGDLRDRLGAGGVRTGALTVSDGSVGSRGGRGGNTERSSLAAPGGTSDDPTTDSPAPLLPTPDSDSDSTSLLDVRV